MMISLFDENGVRVDTDYVRFGGKSLRVHEIKVVESGINTTDSDTAKVAWFFAAILFIMSLLSPWLFILTFAATGMALYKQAKPVVHTLRVSTGGLFNSHVVQSTDGQHLRRVREAIEAAISGNRNASSVDVGGAPLAEQPASPLPGVQEATGSAALAGHANAAPPNL